MNKFVFSGRLTSDAATRSGENGRLVVKFRVAVKRDVKRDNEPDADFFSCTAFGKVAERLDKLKITKGTKLIVDGKVQVDEFTDRDGNKRREAVVIVRDFEFAESKSRQDSRPATSHFEPVQDGFGDEDIPF